MFGRSAERERLRGLLAVGGGALVIRGPAGIGKSTLVDDARAEAVGSGFRVLACAGVQREGDTGMAGLQQLLAAVVDRADALPERQRAALRSAFGLGPSTAPDQLVLSVAVLSLLEDLAYEQPLLLIVEDVQWMDQPTVNMVGFVGRRLRESPIVMLATCRDDEPGAVDDLGLPELSLDRLDDADAAALLAETSPGLRREVRDRVLAESQGNPLALVELSRGLVDRGLSDSSTLPARLPLTARLENVFATEAARLPQPVQDLLLLAAAGGSETGPAELTAAARILGVPDPDEQLRVAEQAGLVRWADRTLVFRHPLVRSAIYGAASFPRRLACHRALARLFDGTPERAAWHRSAATVGRDETVARDLETAASAARARGNLGAAMRYLERSAELSPDPREGARRLGRAAEEARQGGLTTAAVRLATAAKRGTTDPVVLADVAFTEAILDRHAGIGGPSVDDMIALARRVAPVDPAKAASVLVSAAVQCKVTGAAPEAGDRVLAGLEPLGAPGAGMLMMSRAFLVPGRYAGELTAVLRAAADHVTTMPPLQTSGLSTAAESVHDWVFGGHCMAAAAEGFRRGGNIGDLVGTLVRYARNLVVQGRLSEAARAADEARRLSADLDVPVIWAHAAAMAAMVAAWRGDDGAAVDHVRADLAGAGFVRADHVGAGFVRADHVGAGFARADLAGAGSVRADLAGADSVRADLAGADSVVADSGMADPAVADPGVAGPGTELAVVRGWARGVRALSAGRRAEAVAALVPVAGYHELAPLVAADLAEAGYRGDLTDVPDFPAALPRLLGHRVRALLAGDDDEAEQHFREAQAVTEYPLQAARTRLLYGEWLRRRRRLAAARDELAAAAADFDHAGARPWAARARAELRAAGVAVQRPAERRADLLTAQELQIAQLASKGRSNKDIADQLFLSHHTVGAHLYRIYPKLGITSRGALRDALEDLP